MKIARRHRLAWQDLESSILEICLRVGPLTLRPPVKAGVSPRRGHSHGSALVRPRPPASSGSRENTLEHLSKTKKRTNLKLLLRDDLLQGTWVPLTWTGDVGLPPAPDPEPERPEPTEESSLDSDL